MLPMTNTMERLNTVKIILIFDQHPHYASNPGTIQTADLMLYGSQTLVLFCSEQLNTIIPKLGRS
jgi:hypothetical protein